MNYRNLFVFIAVVVLVGCAKKSETAVPEDQAAFNECRRSAEVQFNHNKGELQHRLKIKGDGAVEKFLPSAIKGEENLYYLKGQTPAKYFVKGKEYSGSFGIICATRKLGAGKWSVEQVKYLDPKID